MAIPTDETPIEKLRRVAEWVSYEPESLLQELPSVEAIVAFFDLWTAYDTDFLQGIYEAIAEGASAAPYNAFVRKYKLPWRMLRAGQAI